MTEIKKMTIWTGWKTVDGDKVFKTEFRSADSTSTPFNLVKSEILPITFEEVSNLISTEGEVIEKTHKWGGSTSITWRGLKLSLGHINCKGKEGVASRFDDVFGESRAVGQTINFNIDLESAIWKNMPDIIDKLEL